MRFREVGDGIPARRTRPLDLAWLERIHRRLRSVSVEVPSRVDPSVAQALFARIRDRENAVAKLLGVLLPRRGELRGDLTRAERVVESATAELIDANEGTIAARRGSRKDAAVDLCLLDEHDAVAALEADVRRIDEAVAHARLVLEELRNAFEESSRSLAAHEQRWRISRGLP